MNILDQHIQTDQDFVVCQICKHQLTKIDGRHLRKDNTTFQEYIKLFPTSPTITKTQYSKELESQQKRKDNQNHKATKMIQCYYCKETFEGNINLSNKYSICSSCKQKGLKNPIGKVAHESYKQSMLNKYGVDNASKIPEVVVKRNKTVEENQRNNLDYYDNIVQKRVNTIKETYGDNWKEQLHELQKEAMLEKYEVEYAFQKNKFREKAQKTQNKRTNGEYSLGQDPDSQKEREETNLIKRKVKNVMQDPEVSKKTSEGLKVSWKDPEVRKRRNQSYIDRFIPRLVKFLKEKAFLELLEDYQDAFYNHKWKCNKCGYKFNQNWNAIQQGYLCPNCRPSARSNKSIAENEISSFIKSLGFEIVQSNRTFISPFELDIIIHSKQLAIEYCGLYWHQEDIIKDTRKKINDPKKYHLYKLEECIKKGYQLITIFEDEWLFKKDICKNRLKQIFGKSTSKRIHARKCNIFEITYEAKTNFLEKFHIQGSGNSGIYLGAFYEDLMVAVMTFSKGNPAKGLRSKDGIWELNRFCSDSNYHVPGIAGKLLEYFKKNYSWKEIFSYADRRWSDGNLYYKLGFELDHVVGSNYWYIDINKIKRHHRYSLRKKPDEPKDITERVLRISQGYKVLWDCGNLKFILHNEK